MLVLASHQARERLLSKCNEQGIAGLSDFMKEGRLLCCKSESLSCCWFAFMSCCVAGFAFFGSSSKTRELTRRRRCCARRRCCSALIPSLGQERDNEQQQVSKWEVHGARGVISWSGFFSARSRALGPGGRARCRRRSARRRRCSARSAALRGRLRARNGPQIRLHARHGRGLEGPEVAALRRR